MINKLNNKQKRLFKRWSTAINLKQSNEFIFKSFINYYKDITNNPLFMNKDNYNNQNIEWLDLLINEINNNKEQLFKLEYDKINPQYEDEKKSKKNYLSLFYF